MATKTFEELKQMAIQIRDEKTNKQNTATRIGTQMLEHLNKLEQDFLDKDTTEGKFSELDTKTNPSEMWIANPNIDVSVSEKMTDSDGDYVNITINNLSPAGIIVLKNGTYNTSSLPTISIRVPYRYGVVFLASKAGTKINENSFIAVSYDDLDRLNKKEFYFTSVFNKYKDYTFNTLFIVRDGILKENNFLTKKTLKEDLEDLDSKVQNLEDLDSNLRIVNGYDDIKALIKAIYIISLDDKDISFLTFRLAYVSYNTYVKSHIGVQIKYSSDSIEESDNTLLIDTIYYPTWKPNDNVSVNVQKEINGISYKFGIYIITSDRNVTEYPNKLVSAYLTSSAIKDTTTFPAIRETVEQNNNKINNIYGNRIYNKDFHSDVASRSDIYTDTSCLIKAVGKLNYISIDIFEVSPDTDAVFYIAETSADFTKFYIKRELPISPKAGRNNYDFSNDNIILYPGDVIIWGGGHKINYNSNDNNVIGLIWGEGTNINVGDTLSNTTKYSFNYGIQVSQEVNIDDTIEFLQNITPERRKIIEESNNLFNKNSSDNKIGYLVNSDGSISQIGEYPESWFTTEYINLKNSKQITIGSNFEALKQGVCYSLAFYNINKEFISYQFTYEQIVKTLEVPSDAEYIVMTLRTNIRYTFQLNNGTELLPYDDYYYNEYYVSDKTKQGEDWFFKPIANADNINTDLFLPQKIYTVCNDITDNEETAGKRNYAVALFVDHMLSLNQYAKLRFDYTKSDKFPIFSHFTSYGVLSSGGRGWIWNEDNSIIKQTIKQLSIDGIKNSKFTFTHISTRNSATANKKPIILCIGDSVTEGYLANINKPYTNAPNAYWQWVKMFFEFDKKQAGNNYDSLLIGKRNVVSFHGKYIDDTMIDIRACAEGKGGAKLSEYLRSTTVGGVDNHFYDSSKGTENKFSILYWLKQFRTMDDLGVRLTGNAGNTVEGSDGKQYTIGTSVTNVQDWDVCKPTHVIIQLGYNDGDRAGYLDDIIAIMDIIQTEIPDCIIGVSLPDCPGTYFPELYPQYGNDVSEMYPVSYLYGAAKSSHDTFLSMNKKLITVDNPEKRRYYIPNYFISPTAMAAPYRKHNFASYLSSSALNDELRIQGWAAPNLHPNNYAHAAWGYEIYSWIKYTLAKIVE